MVLMKYKDTDSEEGVSFIKILTYNPKRLAYNYATVYRWPGRVLPIE